MNRLGRMLRLWRAANGDQGVREVAAEIGISAATLSRIERGELFDVATLNALSAWLMAEIPNGGNTP